MDGWKCGSKFGKFIKNLNSKIYWSSYKLRKRKYYNQYIKDTHQRFQFIQEFITGFRAHSKLNFVKCDSCMDAIGIDYQSEKHGWNYEGYHYWACPDCLKKKKNNV